MQFVLLHTEICELFFFVFFSFLIHPLFKAHAVVCVFLSESVNAHT